MNVVTHLDNGILGTHLKNTVRLLLPHIPKEWEFLYLGYFLVGEKEEGTLLMEVEGDGNNAPAFADIDSMNKDDLTEAVKKAQDRFGELYDMCRRAGDDWKRAYVVLSRKGELKISFTDEVVGSIEEITGAK